MLELRLAPDSRPVKGQKFSAPGTFIKHKDLPRISMGSRMLVKTRASIVMN